MQRQVWQPQTPIAAVILAIELLLFEFRRALYPLVVATVVATTVRMPLLEGKAPFSGHRFRFPGIHVLYLSTFCWVFLCGLAALGFTRALYWVETCLNSCRLMNSGCR